MKKTSSLAGQFAVRALFSKGSAHRMLGMGLRRFLPIWTDPLISVDWDYGSQMIIPLSHPLPVYRSRYREYDVHLGHIARVVGSNYPDMCAIDVGANVGDSIPQLRTGKPSRILCVEGSPRYLRYLADNTRDDPDVEIAPVFVGPPGMLGDIEIARGTGRIIPSADGQVAIGMSLAELIVAYPTYAAARLVKIDTDGMDWSIMRSGLDWLAGARPVLFFEHDPRLSEMTADDVRDGWRELSRAGYSRAMFFKNTGEYVGDAPLGTPDGLEELISTVKLGRGGYFDVCAFSAKDVRLIAPIQAGLEDFDHVVFRH